MSSKITRNETLMDESLRHMKMKGLKNEILDQINHVRFHKKLHLLLELVGEIGRPRTHTVDTKNIKSQLKSKFDFPTVEELGPKSMRTGDQFKKWIVDNDYHTS